MPTKDAKSVPIKKTVYERCKKVMEYLETRDDVKHTWETFLTFLLDLQATFRDWEQQEREWSKIQRELENERKTL